MILPLEAASMIGNKHEKVLHRGHSKAYRSIRFIDLWSKDYRHPQPVITRKKINRLWVLLRIALDCTQCTSHTDTVHLLRLVTKNAAPRAAHTWYRIQGCVIHRGIKAVGREPSWCRVTSEYHKALDPFFIPN